MRLPCARLTMVFHTKIYCVSIVKQSLRQKHLNNYRALLVPSVPSDTLRTLLFMSSAFYARGETASLGPAASRSQRYEFRVCVSQSFRVSLWKTLVSWSANRSRVSVLLCFRVPNCHSWTCIKQVPKIRFLCSSVSVFPCLPMEDSLTPPCGPSSHLD